MRMESAGDRTAKENLWVALLRYWKRERRCVARGHYAGAIGSDRVSGTGSVICKVFLARLSHEQDAHPTPCATGWRIYHGAANARSAAPETVVR
jgi:hypothetical protein